MNEVDLSSKDRAGFRRRLLAWFRRNARNLPWRRTRDPYRIWVSEILLQQTRIEAVIPYYNRFIETFPTVAALAAAGQDEVLKAWEGLGYYSRARHLHAAARILVDECGGRFPKTSEGWRKLPGVGPYTAAAVASIAFGEPAPALDGNVQRVLARLFAVTSRIDKSATRRHLRWLAEALISPKAPGDFNQAMMDLGASICTPKRPRCRECPVRRYCRAYATGRQEDLPVRRAGKAIPHHEIVAAVIRKNGRFLLGKRPEGGMLAGLWEFPGGKVEPGETHEQALVREVKEETGIEVRVGGRIATVDHAYSHFTIRLHAYACEHVAGKPRKLYHTELKWVPRSRLKRYALPAANRKFLDRL